MLTRIAKSQNNQRLLLPLLIIILVLLPGFGHANPGAAVAQTEIKKKHNTGMYKDGELLVKFKAGTPDEIRREIHAAIGSEVIREFHSIEVQQIRLKKGLSVDEALRLYLADPHIEYAEPVSIVEIQQ